MGLGTKPGILALAEEVYIACEDMNLNGTEYHNNMLNPRVIYIRCDLPERTIDMNSDKYPNLLRKKVIMSCYRVRHGAGSPAYRVLLTSIREKLLANAMIQEIFGDRIIDVPNENEPRIDGISSMKPFLGMLDEGWIVDPIKPSYQREEIVPLQLFVYHQTYPKEQHGILTNPL